MSNFFVFFGFSWLYSIYKLAQFLVSVSFQLKALQHELGCKSGLLQARSKLEVCVTRPARGTIFSKYLTLEVNAP